MGFFSQECRGCEHSAISIHAANDANTWMTNIVTLNPDGTTILGEYDGYGRIETTTGSIVEDAVGYGAEIWHQDCWKATGSPAYTGPSPDSDDQGYFFEDADYNHQPPTTLADMRAIARKRNRE